MGPVRELSPAAGGRLMGTRCQEKEAQEMIATMQKTIKETQAAASEGHLLLRQKFTDLQKKTSRDLDKLTKYAKILNKVANVTVGAAIIGVPWFLIAGRKDQA
ncbi:uncharacterized protein LOC124686107 [Lolium rigidum]|uniref:uncharacterized protein LOC124686107 n=1 Tax=Lolium rigidum TaxID=89674 RepID=UPI001F5DD5F9|nr:uncharacterized protein LOC124686107 [Lolium rigidum]